MKCRMLEHKQKSTKDMNRRGLLKSVLYGSMAASLAPVLWVGGCDKWRAKKKLNIILIVIDTLRADHVSCYGYERNITPNIDRLASEGVLFKNAIVTSPWTLPSVASILTSQYPSVLGIREKIKPIDSSFPTLSGMLKQYNYTTHGIVSHVLLSARLGFGRGFDSYDEKSMFGHEGISSPPVTQKAVSFLQQSHNKPFFLFLHYFDPHFNYLLHKGYNYYPSYSGKLKSGESILKLWQIRHSLSQDDIRYLVSLYDSEIAFTDEYIGRLFDGLKKQGLYDNSIIILTADHGEEFMERGWIGHTVTLYQELIRVPFIMKLPGYKAKIVNSPVSLIDVVPTIYRQLGLEVPDGLDGKALDFGHGPSVARGPVFSETFNPQIHQPGRIKPIAFRSIVLGDSKLIYDEIRNSRQMYDLSDDQYEQNDLSAQNSERNNRLKALLSNWINYVKTKQKLGPVYDESELFTPEQRKQLESLGYL